jgi:cobalamin biosynthesis protein CobD/CbiB
MKKEEIPTFLNEQPTIIFGRTGRELLIIICGIVAGYAVWNSVQTFVSGIGGRLLSGVLAAIPAILSLIVALMSIGDRPLEEWFFVWLLYVCIPKIYLYKPLEDIADSSHDKKANKEKEKLSSKNSANDLDDIEED